MSATTERPDVRGIDAPDGPVKRRPNRTGAIILRYTVLVLLALIFISPLIFMLQHRHNIPSVVSTAR